MIRFHLSSVTVVALFICLTAGEALAQHQVTGIQVNGQNVGVAQGVRVATPNSRPAEVEVRSKQTFAAGTVIETPAQTILQLRSVNGATVTVAARSKLRLVASSRGESYTAFAGRLLFSIKKGVASRLSFFNVKDSGNKIQAAVRGTEFSTTIGPKGMQFQRTEGQVAVSRKVRVKIANAGGASGRRAMTTTKTEYLSDERSELSYDFDYFDTEYEEFQSYQEAEQAIWQDLQQNGDDPEILADGYTSLGYLYLDREMPAQAIEYFTKVLNIYQEIDPEDPLIADTYIDLADAYQEREDLTTATQYLNKAREIIELDLKFNRDDLNYYQSKDPEMAWSIAMDLIDNYENLAWTYELQDDEYTAQQYFEKARQLKAIYGE